MTREITISVPDDIADQLEKQPNISEFVTEAVSRQMRYTPKKKVDQRPIREVLESIGFRFTEEGLAEAKRKLDEAAAKMTPELKEWARRTLAEKAPHRVHEWPQA